MLLYLASIVAGFIVITWSADRFVVGAAVTARRLGVPTLIIGLTVVGFGTSAPELLVSGIAAWQNSPGIAVGNALGSNITNIGLILGLTALCYPLTVRSRILHRELPLLLAIMAVAWLLMLDLRFTRTEGTLLLIGLVALLVWLARQGDKPGTPADVIGLEYADEIPREMSLRGALTRVATGLVLLLLSSRLLVWAAVAIARELGVDDLVIGLTIVALGTSLPELAASIVSARKGEHDIAIGNVIGSNMFNLLGVMGLAGVIAPYRMERISLLRDFPVMAVLTLAFFAMAYGFRGEGRVNRLEGAVLVLAYLAYQIAIYWTAKS